MIPQSRKYHLLPRSLLIFLAIVGALSWFIALAHSARQQQSSASATSAPHALNQDNPAVNLHESREVVSQYIGDAQLQEVLRENLARPLSLTSGDFDEDGMPDLVAAYVGPSSGILVLDRGNVDALYPNSPHAEQRRRKGEDPDEPFLSPAQIFAAPEAPEFIGAGDFDADGHLDIITAARGSNSLYLLAGDGHGHFRPTRAITLPGPATALTTGEINRRDGLEDVVVGVVGAQGPQALIYASAEGALHDDPEVISLPAEARALALGRLSGSAYQDLAIGAGNQLLIVEGREQQNGREAANSASAGNSAPPVIDQLSFSNSINTVVVGDFPAGVRQRIALLQADGTMQVVSRGAKGWQHEAVDSGTWPGGNGLVKARVSTHGGDDLVVLEGASRQLQILSNEDKKSSATAQETAAGGGSAPPARDAYPIRSADTEKPEKSNRARSRQPRSPAAIENNRTNTVGNDVTTESASVRLNQQAALALEGAPAAVLPMRLTRDATSSLVVLRQGQSAPEVMTGRTGLSPQATFTVTNTNDGDGGSLRQAIVDANNSPGADTIIFDIPITGCQFARCIQTITPLSPFPTITDPVVIDGYSQPGTSPNTLPNGDNAVLLIQLNGASAGSADGLNISAGNSTVRGLVINRFNGSGIFLGTNGNNIIEGNFIGTDVTGTSPLGNIETGVGLVNVAKNLIGGTIPAARNIISGNGAFNKGFQDSNIFVGGKIANGNSIQGNYIGPDASGINSISASFAAGVVIAGAPDNLIGGTTAGARNLISGNLKEDGVVAGSAGVFIGLGRLGSLTFPASDAIGNLVQGNYIGTDVTGTIALANFIGVSSELGPNTIVGGPSSGARNIISGNLIGISFDGFFNTPNPGVIVQGNYIGTDVTGTIALGNGLGVGIVSGSNNIIGGTAAGARNIISGNGFDGAQLIGPEKTGNIGNIVQGNYIGTDVTGSRALANGRFGVNIVGGTNIIGGATASERNLISGNSLSGIQIETSAGNIVQGNYIGTDVSGTVDIGNGTDVSAPVDDRAGVVILDGDNNTIGGTTAGARNIISGNGSSGVVMIGPNGNNVQGNYIGTDVTGTAALGNDDNGVTIHGLVNANNNIIGGTTAGAANIIAFNAGAGVSVTREGVTSISNSIRGNSIFSNGGLGIDLGSDGVTPNDPCDADTGANNLQNFPVLTTVGTGFSGQIFTTNVQGTLNSTANTTFTIDFYASTAVDPSGNGEGQTYLGSTTVTTDAACSATLNISFDADLSGQYVSATATDPGGNTSEFSAAFTVPPTSLQFSGSFYTVFEGAERAIITVTRTGGGSGAASVQFSTTAGGTATGGIFCSPGVDYLNTSGTLNWADGDASSKTFPVNFVICDDNVFEGIETVNLTLSGASGATLGAPNSATLEIFDNDSQPTVSINDVTRTEGKSGTTNFGFTVSLSNPTSQTVTVNYATADGAINPANGGIDYQVINPTTLTFDPEITSLPVNVQVIGDTLNEADETFFVNLTNATNATIGDSQGVGTITNDDVSITGRVVDVLGNGLGGVTITVSGVEPPATTDPDGNYSFNGLEPGKNYTVTPSTLSGNYKFDPKSQTFVNVIVNRIANFVATQTVASISGKVTNANGDGLANVMLTLTKIGGPAPPPVSTDMLGNYVFSNLEVGSSYVVTPIPDPDSPLDHFLPSSQSFANLSKNEIANFVLAPNIPPQCGIVSFEAAQNFPVGNSPAALAVGDFNRDGQPDLAVVNSASNSVSILLNDATVRFGPQSNFPVAANPAAIAVGDFNSDSKPDIAVAGSGTSNLSILLGDGTGMFGSPTSFSTGTLSAGIAVGDFNVDGKQDLVITNTNNSVSILLGNGAGGFGAASSFPVGSSPLGVSVADLNSDGKLDLVTANSGSNNISILLGNGTGGFGAATNFSVGSGPASVALGDLNGDGKLDLASANSGSGNVSILLGDGTSGFGAEHSFPVGTSPASIAAGDFNGDGKLDLVTANRGSNNVSVLVGNGFGSFAAATNFSAGPALSSVVVGDFNFDGKIDLASTSSTSSSVSALFNNGQTCNTTTNGFTIQGQITDSNENPLADITLTLSGAITRVVQTDAGGNYFFRNLTGGRDYVVTVQTPYFLIVPSRGEFFNLSSNQTLNFTAAPGPAPSPTPPPSDNFDSPVRNPSIWTLGTETQPVASDPQVRTEQVVGSDGNGKLVITPLSQVSGLHYNGYVSASSFDVRGGAVSVAVPTAASGGAETNFAIGSDSDNFYRFTVHTVAEPTSLAAKNEVDGHERPLDKTPALLILQVKIAGVLASLGIPYDPVQHKFMRFRHEPETNSIVFETSPSGKPDSYTVVKRVVLQKAVAPMTAELSAGTSSPTDAGPAEFDNFNLATKTFQFSAASYKVKEDVGSVEITVTRSDSSGAATVDYATADGTASQRTKYISTAGTLTFAPGETSKKFTVLVIDNAVAEGNKTVNLLLSNPVGAGLNGGGRAVLTIEDNDSTQPTTNPLDDPLFFVQQQYYDFLSRSPDRDGLNYWIGQITQCNPLDVQCIRNRRIAVSDAFFFEPEFQQTGGYVFRLYRAAFGNSQPFPNPDSSNPTEAHKLPSYAVFSQDRARVVGGANLAQALQDLANAFVLRPEFLARYPTALSDTAFLDLILATIKNDSGVDLATQRNALIAVLNQGGRGAVLYRLADDNLQTNPVNNRAFIDAEYNPAFVLAEYSGYLRRDADIGGFLFWLGQANRFPVRNVDIQHALVCSFLTSVEYQLRFSSVATHSNAECPQ